MKSNSMEFDIMIAIHPSIDKKIQGKEIYTTCSLGCQGYKLDNEDDAGYILTFGPDGEERYLITVHKLKEGD